jgi:hypothetical protein
VIEIKNKDLDKILLMMKYVMDERPDLNEKLMDFYCYLQEMKSSGNRSGNRSGNLKRITVEKSTAIDMNLDELIWKLDMVLPSWDKLSGETK